MIYNTWESEIYVVVLVKKMISTCKLLILFVRYPTHEKNIRDLSEFTFKGELYDENNQNSFYGRWQTC